MSGYLKVSDGSDAIDFEDMKEWQIASSSTVDTVYVRRLSTGEWVRVIELPAQEGTYSVFEANSLQYMRALEAGLRSYAGSDGVVDANLVRKDLWRGASA